VGGVAVLVPEALRCVGGDRRHAGCCSEGRLGCLITICMSSCVVVAKRSQERRGAVGASG
jgi:hypothetical protein